MSALGNTVHLFATNPDQWELLRADPSLARPAFEETIRLESFPSRERRPTWPSSR